MRSPMGLRVARRLSAILRGYRLVSAAAVPLVPLLMANRLKRGKEDRARLGERRGEASFERPPGPLVWLHGASVGEIASILQLAERLQAQKVSLLVTSGTVTSASLAGHRLPRGVIHQFVPVDSPRFVRRFLDHWQPDLALLVESDLWPNLIIETAARGTPLILVNARLSESSYDRWRHFPATIGALLDRFDLCLARTATDAERFTALGAPRVTTAGNLKLDSPAPPVNDEQMWQLKAAIGERPVVAAASTHPGEETAVIEVHRRLRARFPKLLTIIAPRHAERGPGIAEIAAVAGQDSALRSRGELPAPGTEIYIADTMGELGMIYRLAPIVFVGGSLVRHGGQNPIEPAKLGAAVLHGPHVGNFAEIYAALDTAAGAQPVADTEELVARMGNWLSDPRARNDAANAAFSTVESLGGALERTLQALNPYLMQLRLAQGADHNHDHA